MNIINPPAPRNRLHQLTHCKIPQNVVVVDMVARVRFLHVRNHVVEEAEKTEITVLFEIDLCEETDLGRWYNSRLRSIPLCPRSRDDHVRG